VNVASRFPSLKQLAPVYSVGVVAVYGFSIMNFLWRVPSLINYSTMGQVGVIFSYMIVVNLIESLMIVFMPIVLSVILPGKWFFEQFVTKGVLLVSLGLGYFGYISSHINTEEDFPYPLFKLAPFVAVVILALVFLLARIKFVQKSLEWVAEQLEVFLFLSIPLSAIALVVVLIRNIF
jgi:hypothetical protein